MIIALLLLILLFLSICLLFSPIILIVYSLLNGFHNSISNILFSISLAGLGIIFIVLTFKIMHIVHKLILRYLLWYIKQLKEALENEEAFH